MALFPIQTTWEFRDTANASNASKRQSVLPNLTDELELGKSPRENKIAFSGASIARWFSHEFPRSPMQNQLELKIIGTMLPDVDFFYSAFRKAYAASSLSGHE